MRIKLIGGRRDGFDGSALELRLEPRVRDITFRIEFEDGPVTFYIEFEDDDDETYSYILTDPDLFEFELVKGPDTGVPAVVRSAA